MFITGVNARWHLKCRLNTGRKHENTLTRMLEKIKIGLQYANTYLEKAKDIADLVSASLGHAENRRRGESDVKKDKTFGTTDLVSAFFRVLGLDSQKIAMIAVNSVVFLAQMISSMFEVKPHVEHLRTTYYENIADPFSFLMGNKNERIKRLVQQAQDPNLPRQLIARLDGMDSSCIRLLICKASPVIRATQKSLTNATGGRKSHHITSWLPSKEDFEENSDECEEKHVDCPLFPRS